MRFGKYGHLRRGFTLANVVLLALSSGAMAETTTEEINPIQIELSREAPGEYTGGQALEIVVTISASTTEGLTALGLYETIPPGWQYLSLRGISSEPPSIAPAEGEMELLQFAYISPPAFPIIFAYSVLPPEDAGGTAYITGQVEYRTDSGALKSSPVMTQIGGPDNEPPVITLLGDNPVTIERGAAYEEPGYTATDNVDGDVSNKVRVLGVVDYNTVGEYTLTYLVSDQAGNEATAAQRTVIVVASETDTNNSSSGGSSSGTSSGAAYGNSSAYDPEARNTANKQSSAATAAAAKNAAQNAAQNAAEKANLDKAAAEKKDAGAAKDISELIKGRITDSAKAAADALAAKKPGENTEAKPGEEEKASDDGTAPAAAADAPETSTATGDGNTISPAAGQSGVASQNIESVADAPGTPADIATAPVDSAPGFFAQASEAISKMTRRQIMALGVMAAISLILFILAAVGWRKAYGAPPRRRPPAAPQTE